MNPTLKNLGFGAADRVAILHVDDIGMCQASVAAFTDLWSRGVVLSGSVMVPCPWFPSVAEWHAQHRDADLGVHVTLTCEWSSYRWGPVAPTDPADNLTDGSGRYFHARAADVDRLARTEAVKRETEAQLELARRAGLNPTHMDSHMFTSFQPRFLPDFLDVSIRNRLPAMVPRARLRQLDPVSARQWEQRLHENNIPVFEQWAEVRDCENVQEFDRALKTLIAGLPPGLTCILFHPAQDCAELRAISKNWRRRVMEFEVLKQNKVWDYAADADVKLIDYGRLTPR